jgi:hypothetical protein
MNQRVFPRNCFDGEIHDIYCELAPKTGGDRVLYCRKCGDAVPLAVAVARTPTPTVVTTSWVFENGVATNVRTT